jgi:hypothetical protein
MTALVVILVCLAIALTASGYVLGAIVERRAWLRSLDRARCFRCDGRGIEPRRKGRWAE